VRRTVFAKEEPRFTWVDVVNPSAGELAELADEYRLHPTSVQDCLDPTHLPKLETIAGTTFVILRAWDASAPHEAVSAQAATRKVAAFYSDDFLLTVHRTEQPYLTELFERHSDGDRPPRLPLPDRRPQRSAYLARILIDLFQVVLDSYDAPLATAEAEADEFEESLFASQDIGDLLRRLYVIKRRALLIKRMLLHTVNVLHRMVPAAGPTAPLFQDVRENLESQLARSDALLDEVNGLLNIHLALASHRTSEVMRVLTLFSVFFLPLTFIVGVYGMNFDVMPELRQRWGYPAVLLAMLLVVLAIHAWFRRNGWLRR
jgi:magnesium transporter